MKVPWSGNAPWKMPKSDVKAGGEGGVEKRMWFSSGVRKAVSVEDFLTERERERERVGELLEVHLLFCFGGWSLDLFHPVKFRLNCKLFL